MSKSKLALSWITLVVVAHRAEAQELLRTHVDGYGAAATVLADLDGDGVRDYAVARFDPKSGGQETVEVRSGRSGALIRSIPSGAPAGVSWYFGFALAELGDVDADGVPDLLVGALLADDPNSTFIEPGGAFVYSGSDGHLLCAVYGGADKDWLGGYVAALDDVDGDGHADFLVGASAVMGSSQPYVNAFSGATGAILYTMPGAVFVATLSDRDGDGLRDFAALGGSLQVASGASGAILATFTPPPPVGFLGGVAEIDDIDGDGANEIVLGETDPVNRFDGQVRVLSVPTLTTLRLHPAVDSLEQFGERIDSVDADGDGVRDYLVGATGWFTTGGSASLFSGRTGERLYRFVDPLADYFMGSAVAGLGDLDGDGFAELAVGSPYHVPPGTIKYGADLVFRGNDLWLDAYPKSVVAGATETVAIHGAPNGNPVALFVVDFAGSPAFQLAGFGVANSLEAFDVSGTVPVGLAGSEWTLRAYALDANGKLMVSADEVLAFN